MSEMLTQTKSIEVKGPKGLLEKLRRELQAEAKAAQFVLSEPILVQTASPSSGAKVRQLDAIELIAAFIIHVPAGIVAHATWEWLRDEWLRAHADAAQARYRVVDPPADDKPKNA